MKTLSREEYNEIHFPDIKKWTDGMLKGEGEWKEWMKKVGVFYCSFCDYFSYTKQSCPFKAVKCNGHGCSSQFREVEFAYKNDDYPAYQEAAAAMLKHVISCDYDYYLSLIYEKEKPKEPKKQPLYMDWLYMCEDGLVGITLYNKIDGFYSIEYIEGNYTGGASKDELTPATKEQIMEAYGFQVGDEKVVYYEDEDGDIRCIPRDGTELFFAKLFFATRKALLKAAGVKYIPNAVWEKMKEES